MGFQPAGSKSPDVTVTVVNLLPLLLPSIQSALGPTWGSGRTTIGLVLSSYEKRNIPHGLSSVTSLEE